MSCAWGTNGCRCDHPACEDLRAELSNLTGRYQQLAAHVEVLVELDDLSKMRGKEFDRALLSARGIVSGGQR
jgi:hypothetical protein